MIIRKGFISNSSTTSFWIYGVSDLNFKRLRIHQFAKDFVKTEQDRIEFDFSRCF
jgi:hypothetical protein